MFARPIDLSPEQIKFYDDNGYLVVPRALSLSECEMAIHVYEYHSRKSENINYDGVMNLDRPEEWRHVYGPDGHWVNGYVRQMIAKHPILITCLETLHKTAPGELILMQTQFLYKKHKIPGRNAQFEGWNPHQDGYYHGAHFGGTITGNIAFNDQDRENGCMFIYPGSHKIGRFLEVEKKISHHEKPGQKPGNDVTKTLPKEFVGKEIDLPMKQGSILILHSGVVHGSYPNESSDRDRPMYLAPYKTVGIPFSIGKNGKRMEIPIR